MATRLLIGAVLLLAWALKLHQLVALSTVQLSHFGMAVALYELSLGLWLCSNAFPAVSHAVSLATFICYLAVSVYTGIAGDASCGCFGSLALSPWVVGFVDVVVIALLLLVCPSQPSVLYSVRDWIGVTGVWLILTFTSLLMFSTTSWLPVVAEPSHLIFEPIFNGGHSQLVFDLINNTDASVDIAKVSTSCDCLTITLSTTSISPRGKVQAVASLSFAESPLFSGRLRLHATGISASGIKVFSVTVEVVVK